VFANRVIIHNGQGYCRDTLVQPNLVKVSGPTANFTGPSSVCQADFFAASDISSTAFQANPMVSWRWDFGNGITSTDKNPQPVKYRSSGKYDITLTVEDIDGCTNTITRKLTVNRQPLIRIVPRSQKVCQGQDVNLRVLHKSPVVWSLPGMNGCDTCSSIVIKPMAPEKILVKTTDKKGCISQDSVNVDVWMSFDLPVGVLRDTSICIGSSVPLDLKIAGKFINWQPSSGLSANGISNPIAKPDVTTRYTAVVTDESRCFTRTASALIEVNPIPEIDPGPDLVLPYNTPFTIRPAYSTPIASYNWQPAQLLSCSNCAEPSGRATVSSLFTVKVVSDKGCKSSAQIKLTLDCSEKNLLMPTAFTPNNDGLNDFFYPLTRGVSVIRRFVIYNRLGELIYEKRDFRPNDNKFGWNGMYQGKLQPAGSFVYFVEAECELGNTLSTKGNVVLMR
jgi:gliding motility-associated-like protein